MIYLIVNRENTKKDGGYELVVSHGIDMKTGNMIIMPPTNPMIMGGVFDMEIGEWVIYEEEDRYEESNKKRCV